MTALAGVGRDHVLQPDQTLALVIEGIAGQHRRQRVMVLCRQRPCEQDIGGGGKRDGAGDEQAAYQSPRRSANARPIDLLQFEDIADAAHRMKQLGLEPLVDLSRKR